MVKLIVIARCIPEDVYLRSLESLVHPQLAGEKKFPVVVREPEEWPIGRLANEIKTRYESLYKRPFGQVKYLKDNEDDCDLDPDLTVADLLVDEGKAARDGSDQKKTIKLIQEQGRAVRHGSVIPDLTPIHYQPRTLPPIPRFPGTERRRTEDRQVDDRPTKRRRLDQVEEETNQIVDSIERDALNGNLRNAEPVVEPKIESPELASTWINTGPATIDELELLPEAPAHFRPRSRGGPGDSRRRHEPGPEIRESSAIPHEEQQQRDAGIEGRRSSRTNKSSVKQTSIPHTHAPITPSNSGANVRTPGGQVVTMLNSMKSQSPVVQQSTSASASRFRNPAKNVFDYPESDIDDTQMSPRSRALRSRITPKLVRTPHSKGKPRVIDGTSQRFSKQASVVQESPSGRRTNGHDSMEVDDNQEHQLPHLRNQEQSLSSTRFTTRSLERAEREQDNEVASQQQRPPRDSINGDGSSVLGSDETWSVHEDGTKRKKARQSRNQRRSGDDVSTSRSSSMNSSAKNASNTDRSGSSKLKRERVAPTKVTDGQSRSEVSELDSPGIQLSETLRRSSPVSRPSKETSQNTSEAVTRSTRASEQERQAGLAEDVEMDDIERSPESVLESEEDLPLAKAPKRPKTKNTSLQSVTSEELRCLTCWTKKNRCDNKQPKCSACTRNKKNCQSYNLTKEEAQSIRDERNAEKASKAASSQKHASKVDKAKSRAKTSELVDPKDGAADVASSQRNLEASQTRRTNGKAMKSKPDSEEEENAASSEEEVSTSSADESTRSSSKSTAPKNSQTKRKKSMTDQRSTTKSSKEYRPADDLEPDVKSQDNGDDSKEASASTGGQQESDTKDRDAKGRNLKKTSEASPVLSRNKVIKAKSSEVSNDLKNPVAMDNARSDLPTTPKDAAPLPTEKLNAREQSIETRVTSTGKILPQGMTEEEYESLVGSRASLTEQQRRDQKMRNRKLEKRAESTPSLVHQSSTQELAERTKQGTPSVRSSQQISLSQSASKVQSKQPPSTQPARASASVKSATPMSAPAKTKPEPQTNSSSKSKLKLQPASTTTGVKIKSPNPPFQPHQPQAKPQPAASTANPSTTKAPSSLTASRTLKDIRAVLTSQSRSGSGASTPQPAHTTAARIAEIRRGANAANARKNITSLSDDEDDDDDDSDEDEEEEEDVKGRSSDAKGVALNAPAKANVTIRRKTPSDSGSGSASEAEESESESGSGSGSGSGSDESASGSEDEDEEED